MSILKILKFCQAEDSRQDYKIYMINHVNPENLEILSTSTYVRVQQAVKEVLSGFASD
jgi:hypothetical protein